jgi:hypothetical protein
MQYTCPEKYNQTKPKLYAIHMSGEIQPVETICNFFTFICHSCLY